MEKKELLELKELYTNIRQDLIKSLNKEVEELDIDGDPIDEIQGLSIANLSRSLSVRDFARLKKINNALLLIENGSIDECDECGNSIGYKRLHAIPGVRICIACAEEAEMKSKMFA